MDTKKRNIVIALMLAMFLAAMEGTIVTMATPTIVADLQGFELISLVFSVYLLTSAISTPVYGKLSDLYGRKNVLSIGITIFLIGCLLCGLAQSMTFLIVSRAIQGLGAGAIFTISYTIVGDLFPFEKRAKVQGALGTVWGISSLIGPFFGGVLIDLFSWHWIFFINIPFGLLSIIILQKTLVENFERKKHSIDYAGIFTLATAILVFLNIFLSTGSTNTNQLAFIFGSIAMTTALLFLFYKIEKNAQEPIMPFDIFTKSSTFVNGISFFASAVLVGISVYMPLFMQNVLGFSATVSGLAMLPMSASWLIMSFILGRFLVRYGGKKVLIASSTMMLISAILLLTLGTGSSLVLVLIYLFIIGFAFGGAFTTLTIIVQDSVEQNKRGTAVAVNSLLRSLGQTIGISIFGGMFNLYIAKYFIQLGIEDVNSSNLYQITTITNEQIQLSLHSSLHVLFIVFVLISALALIASVYMPKFNGQKAN